MPTSTDSLKALVQGAYDVQKLRVAIGNRICQAWYQAHGVNPGDKPKEKLDEENQKILARIIKEWKQMAEGVKSPRRRDTFKPTEWLPVEVILPLCQLHDNLGHSEADTFKAIEHALEGIPIYDEFLRHIVGCGPAMSGVLLARFDIRKAERPSQFWAYAGLDVGPDGRGRSRRKEHLVEREYKDREGKTSIRASITYDPFLRTKLFVLATCFMRNNNRQYRKIYDDYKNRLVNHSNWKDKTPGHRNNAARRYMLKMFLLDFWREWRQLEDLPVVGPYAEDKLQYRHRDRDAAD